MKRKPLLPTLVLTLLAAMQPLTAQVVEDTRASDHRQQQQQMSSNPLAHWPMKNIGPTIMSGRVTDLAVNPQQTSEFWVAYASGGLWHTTNNGTTFDPWFQQEAVMTIGAIDVNWKSGRIYLGSGEVNSSRSSYAGNGVYRSDDGGKSWQHLGLDDTHHIGRVITDQGSGDTVWVAALGHLYTPNAERGIYRSTDGGRSWAHTLYIDQHTGAVDLIRDPRRPNVFYASTWERSRSAWNFEEAGEGSAIFRSTDYGMTWTEISTAEKGWPDAATNGRIGLAMSYTTDGQPRLYATMDNYARRPAEEDDPYVLTKAELKMMTPAEVQKLPNYQLDQFLRANGYPRDLDADLLRSQLEDGSLSIEQLLAYLEDANKQLFDTPVIALEVYALDSDNANWRRTHDGYINSVYNSYGYYFGEVAANPNDADQLYVMGVPILRSDDGGATFEGINAGNVHADHHALWINPDNPDHLVNGNDGGVNISYDAGRNWIKCNSPMVGQFYTVAVDDHPDGYRVYGGLQDNGVWRGPGSYEYSTAWLQNGSYPYERLMGGDGMQVAIDPRDNETVYTGYQFGNYFRINPEKNSRTYITPRHELGKRPYRWNWQSPIHLSVHQPDVVYFGSNHLHRSLNQGDDWTIISGDLTDGGQPGDVPFGTLSSIHESPLRFGLLYTGSDDGRVYRSHDGGYSWTAIEAGLPPGLWVSRIRASSHREGRVYLTLNGYRNDDFTAYVYRSDDYGDSWQSIKGNLPAEPINVILEDPENENLLFVGTDHGMYLSFDGGSRYDRAARLPRVAVHDLAIQPTARHLLVGTHGRSIFRADLNELTEVESRDALTLLDPGSRRYSERWGGDSWWGSTRPEHQLHVYAPRAGTATLEVYYDDMRLQRRQVELPYGFSSFDYDLSYDGDQAARLQQLLRSRQEADQRPIQLQAADDDQYYLPVGVYTLKLKMGEDEALGELEIK